MSLKKLWKIENEDKNSNNNKKSLIDNPQKMSYNTQYLKLSELEERIQDLENNNIKGIFYKSYF